MQKRCCTVHRLLRKRRLRRSPRPKRYVYYCYRYFKQLTIAIEGCDESQDDHQKETGNQEEGALSAKVTANSESHVILSVFASTQATTTKKSTATKKKPAAKKTTAKKVRWPCDSKKSVSHVSLAEGRPSQEKGTRQEGSHQEESSHENKENNQEEAVICLPARGVLSWQFLMGFVLP